MCKTPDFNTNWKITLGKELDRNKTMLRFLFKSQLSDRNAIPVYIALKTPAVCIWRKMAKYAAATWDLNSF